MEQFGRHELTGGHLPAGDVGSDRGPLGFEPEPRAPLLVDRDPTIAT
jgi:hypothetical protein